MKNSIFQTKRKTSLFRLILLQQNYCLFLFPSHDENCDCGYCHDSKTDSRIHACMVHKSCLWSNCVGCIITAVSSRCRGCAWSRCLTRRRILGDRYASVCCYIICIIGRSNVVAMFVTSLPSKDASSNTTSYVT